MKLLKFFAVMALFIMSCFPLVLSSVYLFSGGNRQAFMDMLTKIPKERFWLFAVPMVIISYCASMCLLWKTFEIGLAEPKPAPKKEVFYLEDDNLQEKLQGLISSRPGTINLNEDGIQDIQ
jgi:hypothetical protein